MTVKPICPFCHQLQTQKPIKSWTYGKMIEHRDKDGTIWGATVNVSRYLCNCKKRFNFFLTAKGKSWTIPKTKNPDLVQK